jgi:hypothetical protein
MDELANLLGASNAAAAAVLTDTAARDWLSLSSPPHELSIRVRSAAIRIAVDDDRAFLMPFFLLSDRLALCIRIGSTHAPVSGWWDPPDPDSAISRVVVDLVSLAIVEAYHAPQTGVLFRALVCPTSGAGSGTTGTASVTSTLLAAPNTSAAAGLERTTMIAIYRRDLDWPATTLLGASLPPPGNADSVPAVLTSWIHFAEQIHLAFHGPVSITTTVSTTMPGGSVVERSEEEHCTMTVTINDPEANNVLPTHQEAHQPPPPAPQLILPRPPGASGSSGAGSSGPPPGR